jgi:chromosome segregation ATPase
MLKTIIGAMAVVFCISGCSVSTNPREGGLIGGLYGLSSGAYDARLQQRRNELARQQKASSELKRESSALNEEYQLQDRQLAAEQQRVAKLEKDLSRLQARVAELKAKTSKQKTEAANLRQRVIKLRRQLLSQQAQISNLDREGGVAAHPERYRLLKKERDRLATEYRRLVAYSQALSEAAR